MKPKRLFSMLLVVLMLSGIVLAGCGPEPTQTVAGHNHPMAPMEDMPADVRNGPARTLEAYQFSVANPELADAIPCYCGCGGMGHTSSYDCYVAGMDEAGLLEFDIHAQYCSICVDITQDTMRMLDEGKSTAEIFAQIEADYSRFAPPTVKPVTGEA